MDNSAKKIHDYYVIDLMHIIKKLWHRAWLIAIVAIIGAGIGFSVANFAVAPQYSSSVMLYVNNNSFSLGSTSVSISASQISAAQSLVKTYIVILNNRTTLEKVIEKADVDYTYGQLSNMIVASPVDETEVFSVGVTCGNPYDAAKIANAIAEVLPERISEIIEGSSMEVVDSAIVNTNKVSPSITNYTVIGFLLGFIVAAGVLAVFAVMDNTVHDEEYILNTYKYPILAKIPNLAETGSRSYSYYSYGKKHRREAGDKDGK